MLVIINVEILTGPVLTLMRVQLLKLAYCGYPFSANMLLNIFDFNVIYFNLFPLYYAKVYLWSLCL